MPRSDARLQIAEQRPKPLDVPIHPPQIGEQRVPLLLLGVQPVAECARGGAQLPAAHARAAKRLFAHKKVHKNHLSAQIS